MAKATTAPWSHQERWARERWKQMKRREKQRGWMKRIVYVLREDLHAVKVRQKKMAYWGKEDGGYCTCLSAGKKRNKQREKGWEREMKEGKGEHKRKTIIPGRLTSQGFLRCQSGLYSVIDCEGLENSKSLWDRLLRCCGDSSRKNLWRVWKCFQWELHMSTSGKCWVQKIVFFCWPVRS